MNEHVRILTDSAIVINRMAQLLEEAQIPVMVKDNVESARLGGFGSPANNVDLYVHKSNVAAAVAILKANAKD
jgi:hypothetical protein